MNNLDIGLRKERIFITGGAGYLGRHLVQHYYPFNDIIIYSRDEAKHYYLKKQFPDITCIIGDVRDYDLMLRSSKGCSVGIFAASLKQIESVDQNVSESIQILINGAQNSRRVSEENNFESACFVSSDKSRAATTLYGAMKFIAGESFIVNSEKSNVRLSCAIYGNVLNSTGSIIPLIWDSIQRDYVLTLYSEEMTRFTIGVEQAIQLIEVALLFDGFNIIPNLFSFSVKDLFDIYKRKFGLKYQIGEPRISEKIHEVLITKEETPRTFYNSNMDVYQMHYKKIFTDSVEQLTSDTVIQDIVNLNALLKEHNYFKPGK